MVSARDFDRAPNFFLPEWLSPYLRVNSIVKRGSNTFLDVLGDDHAKAASSVLLLKPGVAPRISSRDDFLIRQIQPYLIAYSSRQRFAWDPWHVGVKVPLTAWRTATRSAREPGSQTLPKDG